MPRSSKTENGALREFRTMSAIKAEITRAAKKLTDAEAKKPGVYEVCLYEDAVIYVPESAPVLLRIQYEFGVSAVEAAEHVDHLIEGRTCPCPTDNPPYARLIESRICPCPTDHSPYARQ